MITIQDIKNASKKLDQVVVRTPTIFSPQLSMHCDNNVFLKLEIFQMTGSFKERGAYNKLVNLGVDDKKRGVIAISAGNHAQAVAYHAKLLGIKSVIVMPKSTPITKVANTERWGAEVILHGDNLDESKAYADQIMSERNLVFVHPYDDPLVIAGQGTIGLEILEDFPNLNCLIIPVGGGGMAAGIAIAAKAINPKIAIYGVQVDGFAYMAHKLFGAENHHHHKYTLAEGIAVKSPGEITSSILKDKLEDILLVDDIAIEEAIDTLMRRQNIVAEGAGAAGVAALLRYPDLFAHKKVGIIICGGNIDSRILSSITMRGRMRDGRIARLRIAVADIPGQLAKISAILAECMANVIELKHQRLFYQIPVKQANIDATLETKDERHINKIIKALDDAGFKTKRLGRTGKD